MSRHLDTFIITLLRSLYHDHHLEALAGGLVLQLRQPRVVIPGVCLGVAWRQLHVILIVTSFLSGGHTQDVMAQCPV